MEPAKAVADARSVRAMARWGAALSVLSGIPDGYSVAILRKMVVRGDAAATAANILHAETAFRLGFVADLFGILMFVASAILLYQVFKAASRTGALLFLVLILTGAIFQSSEVVQDLAALALLKGGAGLTAIPPAEAGALALVFLRLHSGAYQLGLFFMGCSSLVMAYVILRSTFVPRFLAANMTIDGLGVLTFTLSSFLAPALAARIYPIIPMATIAVGSFVLLFWLMIRSVNAERWRKQAANGLLAE
jgi:hypothetical protein